MIDIIKVNKPIIFLLISLGAGQLFGAAPTKFAADVWDPYYRLARATMASKPYAELSHNQQAAFRLLMERVYNRRAEDLSPAQLAEYQEFVRVGGLNAIGDWLTKHIRSLVTDVGGHVHQLIGPDSYDELINQIKVVGIGPVYFDGMMRTLLVIQQLEDWLERDGGWQNVAVIEAVIFAFGKRLADDFGYRDLYALEMFGDKNKVELASFLLFTLKYSIYTRNQTLKVAFPGFRSLAPGVLETEPKAAASGGGSGGSVLPVTVVGAEVAKLALLAAEFSLTAAQQAELQGLLLEIQSGLVNPDTVNYVLARDPDVDKSSDRNLHRAQAKALIQAGRIVMPGRMDSIEVTRWRNALDLWE